MNSVELTGRLVYEPKLTPENVQTGSKPKCQFRIAVSRKYRSKDREDADFINCTAYDQQASFLTKYGRKGGRIGIRGRLSSGKILNEDGTTSFYTKVIAEEVEVIDYRQEKPSGDVPPAFHPTENPGYFEAVPDPSEVPFLYG